MPYRQVALGVIDDTAVERVFATAEPDKPSRSGAVSAGDSEELALAVIGSTHRAPAARHLASRLPIIVPTASGVTDLAAENA